VAQPAFAQAPPRDPRTAPAGSAAIRGRVVTSDGFPARQAEVQLSAFGVDRRQTASTDPEGRFAFESIAPGRYALTARQSGYLPFGYGQKAYPGSPEPVTIGTGEELSALQIVLPRGSAIAGRVTNDYGEPVLRATVYAMKIGYMENGQRTMQLSRAAEGVMPGGPLGPLSGSRVTTDDLGEFRLFGLEPGEYVVSAEPLQQSPAQFGRLVQTFYPAATTAAAATPIHLGLSEETTIQLQLVRARLARVAGVVSDSRGDGGAYGLPVALQPRSTWGAGIKRTGNLRDAGEFTIENVPPGDYTLVVSPFPAGESYPKLPGGPEFASMPVSIAGDDITGLRLMTRPAATISGRVVVEGAGPASMGTVAVQAVPEASPAAGLRFRGASEQDNGVRGDGTFELQGLVGPITLQVSPGNGYMLKSVSINGADVTDVPFDPTSLGTAADARVVLTDKVTVVSGTIPAERMDPDGVAIAIVADRVPQGAWPTRYMRVVRPDPKGHFEALGFPPGGYAALMTGPIENTAVFDPQTQARVRESGRSFSLREGEHVTLDLAVTADR